MRKWKCVGYLQDHEKNFTIGKIYKSIDGKGIKGDDGFDYNWASVDEVIKMLSKYYKFEEVIDKKEENNKMLDIKGKKIAVLCDTEEKKVNKFKVGDIVRILDGTKQKLWCSDGSMKKYIGTKGIIVDICNDEPKYKVKCDLDSYYWFFNKEDLKLVSSIQPQQFIITVSDSITTLETNGKKVEIKRYYADKHDVEFAMQEVVNKYFEGVRKEERYAKLPKVGDKVRVVNNGLTYPMFSEWLIQNNVSVKSAIKWKMDEVPSKCSEYTIEMIVDGKALIEDENNAYIICVEGLEVIK